MIASPHQMDAWADALEGKSAEDILRWAAETFAPRVTFATGFGVEGCVIIDIIGRNHFPIDIFTLDTGLLFPETYDLWKKLEQKYQLTIRAIKPAQTVEEQRQTEGDALWERDPDRCCKLRKVVPLQNAVASFDAWISALRRDQTKDRANARIVERDPKFDLVKINPLAAWTSQEIWSYARQNGVPYNILHDLNYPSIGCWPCTTAVQPGEDPRAGRWRGKEKTECGIHTQSPTSA